jgi:hypothetical protein
MPGAPSLLGLGYYAAIKLAGYSAAGLLINRRYRAPGPHPVLFGTARMVLGLVAGLTVGALLRVAHNELLFYLVLAPVRMGEWLLVLWLFYGRAGLPRSRWLWLSVLGSLWSYLLDLPAILAAFTLPGGMWIC